MLFDNMDFSFLLNWLGFSVFCICLLIFGIICLQVKHSYQSKKQERYVKFLNHYFQFFLNNNTNRKIKVDRKNFYVFISFWSLNFNTLNVDSKNKLIEMVEILGLTRICLTKLKSSKKVFSSTNTKELCLIIHTLGNIYYKNKHSKPIQHEIESFMKYKADIVSFEACISLLKIDNHHYCPIVLQEIILRDNWDNRELKYLMGFFDTHETMLMIFDLIKSCNKDNEEKVIKIASRTGFFEHFVNYILQNIDRFSIDSTCLAIKNISDLEDFKLIEHLKKDSNWIYHVNIIQAIVKLNYFSQNNIDYLLKCLSSSNWWVRKRSAQAIVKYYDSDADLIGNLLDMIDDEFAKESLIVASRKYNIINTPEFS